MKKSKRFFSLLEVLIAIFLISLCALPLIYPHAFIYKQTKEFTQEIDLDRVAGLVYSVILEKLYHNEYEWTVFEDGSLQPIDEEMLKRVGASLPSGFEGRYRFDIVKEKSNSSKREPTKETNIISLYLVDVHLLFLRKGMDKPFEYTYEAVIKRIMPNEHAGDAKEETPQSKDEIKDEK